MAAILMPRYLFAQTAKELAQQQKALNEINLKMLDMKPTKDAKKEAKVLKKEGWMVPAGEASIEQQITKSLLYSAELTTDEEGNPTKRYIMQTAQQTSGTYNAGYAAARAAAQSELASVLKTEIISTAKQKLDNSQSDAMNAVTVDKFNERSRMIVDQVLTNAIPVLAIYRRLPNNNFEVQVRMAYDKKVLSTRLKNKLREELEQEGDQLMNDVVDEVLGAK